MAGTLAEPSCFVDLGLVLRLERIATVPRNGQMINVSSELANNHYHPERVILYPLNNRLTMAEYFGFKIRVLLLFRYGLILSHLDLDCFAPTHAPPFRLTSNMLRTAPPPFFAGSSGPQSAMSPPPPICSSILQYDETDSSLIQERTQCTETQQSVVGGFIRKLPPSLIAASKFLGQCELNADINCSSMQLFVSSSPFPSPTTLLFACQCKQFANSPCYYVSSLYYSICSSFCSCRPTRWTH